MFASSLDEVSGQQHEASHKGRREDWLLRHGGHELLRFKLPSGKPPFLIGKSTINGHFQ